MKKKTFLLLCALLALCALLNTASFAVQEGGMVPAFCPASGYRYVLTDAKERVPR